MYVLVVVLVPVQAFCDQRLSDISKCIRWIHYYERLYGIPRGTMHAISLVESGTSCGDFRYRVPAPWAVSVEGKGYRFDSKGEAKRFVNRMLNRGIRNIDVGCMQVNLRYHARSFASLDKALDPACNIKYSASFLRKQYDRYHSWPRAIGCYHSKDPYKSSQYYKKVFKARSEVYYGLYLASNHGMAGVYSKKSLSNQGLRFGKRDNKLGRK
ncbi:transglycosylase SLT domain-containing protein [Candidatus Sneabacter namystus]|nr:transglycosylase SLT domain-containing protein [Candidatus Sneabacter namystus]